MYSRRRKDFRDLATVLNDGWWKTVDGDDTIIYHCCKEDGSCCPGRSHAQREAFAQQWAASAVCKTVLRKRPTKASTNKWTSHRKVFVSLSIPFDPLWADEEMRS